MPFPNAALDQPINAEMDHRETGADSPARIGAGEQPTAQSQTLQHKLGSANESGTQNRATANGAKSRQRSIATRLSWAQRCEREGWRHRESRQGSGCKILNTMTALGMPDSEMIG